MQRLFSVCLVMCAGATPALHAGPRESAIMATMRLSDQPSYSWVATVSDDARTYDIIGKTSKSGFTQVKMPVINAIRRRLGRSVTDTQIELIFRGNVACVIATDEGWLRPEELPPPPEMDPEFERIVSPTGPIGVSGSRSISGGIIKGATIRKTARTPGDDADRERGYSNLQLAISHPHEELGVIVGSHVDFNVEGDVVSGTLTDMGAQLLLVRDGQKEIVPLRASGTFKLWLRDGLVAKYQVRLQGVLSVDTPSGRRQIEVHQSTDTVLKDIATTKVDVPTQARTKLAAIK
jgi:hypothetical protein